MLEHVPIERLRTVAASDELNFTAKEFNHLKRCADCYSTWKEFITLTTPSNTAGGPEPASYK
jgi:hypothetical protein